MEESDSKNAVETLIVLCSFGDFHLKWAIFGFEKKKNHFQVVPKLKVFRRSQKKIMRVKGEDMCNPACYSGPVEVANFLRSDDFRVRGVLAHF